MRKLQKFLSIAFFSLAFFLANAHGAFAALYATSGWGWATDDNYSQGFCVHVGDPNPNGLPICSANGLGWISFSNSTDGSSIPYGVYINGDGSGQISGYAWSSNIGWITFNTTDMVLCSKNPGDSCPNGDTNPRAHINLTINSDGSMVGTGKVDGWARACSVFVSGCSGQVRSADDTGGWDGWIALADPTGARYGLKFDPVTKQFLGPPSCTNCYAWAGNSNGAGMGWGVNLLGVQINTTPPPNYGLTFWPDTDKVLSGGSTNLNWLVTNINRCTKSGDWSGTFSGGNVTDGTHRQSTGALTTSKTYNLQCQDASGNLTSLQTAHVDIVSAVSPQDGKCGIANGGSTRAKPVMNLCDIGSLNAAGVTQSGGNWVWTCDGLNGGNPVACSATIKSGFKYIPF